MPGCMTEYIYIRMIFLERILNSSGEGPYGVRVKAMDCGIVVSEVVIHSRYYFHFRANSVGKGMNPLIFQAMG